MFTLSKFTVGVVYRDLETFSCILNKYGGKEHDNETVERVT